MQTVIEEKQLNNLIGIKRDKVRATVASVKRKQEGSNPSYPTNCNKFLLRNLEVRKILCMFAKL